MADIGSSIRDFWIKSMEAVGRTASGIANNTRTKVDETNLVNHRADILKDFGTRAYTLWQKGEKFPEELEEQLRELSRLDEQLNDLRAERLAGVKQKEEPTPEAENASGTEETGTAAEETGTAAEETAETPENSGDVDAVPQIRVETPVKEEKPSEKLSTAIDDLFHRAPSVDSAAEKVNQALDSLEDGLKKFSERSAETLDEISDRLDNRKDD